MNPSSRLAMLWADIASLARVAWPGAALGSVVATLLFAGALAPLLRSGLGSVVDAIGVVVLTGLALAVLGLAVIIVRLVLDAWTRLFTAALVAPFVFLLIVFAAFDAGGRVGLVVSGAIVGLSAALGGALALVVRRSGELGRGLRTARDRKSVV